MAWPDSEQNKQWKIFPSCSFRRLARVLWPWFYMRYLRVFLHSIAKTHLLPGIIMTTIMIQAQDWGLQFQRHGLDPKNVLHSIVYNVSSRGTYLFIIPCVRISSFPHTAHNDNKNSGSRFFFLNGISKMLFVGSAGCDKWVDGWMDGWMDRFMTCGYVWSIHVITFSCIVEWLWLDFGVKSERKDAEEEEREGERLWSGVLEFPYGRKEVKKARQWKWPSKLTSKQGLPEGDVSVFCLEVVLVLYWRLILDSKLSA